MRAASRACIVLNILLCLALITAASPARGLRGANRGGEERHRGGERVKEVDRGRRWGGGGGGGGGGRPWVRPNGVGNVQINGRAGPIVNAGPVFGGAAVPLIAPVPVVTSGCAAQWCPVGLVWSVNSCRCVLGPLLGHRRLRALDAPAH